MSDATLDDLRAQGAHLHDPVRFRYLEALAMRMQAQPAAVQQVLMNRFREAVADYREQAASPPSPTMQPHRMAPSPLTQLRRHIEVSSREAIEPSLPTDTGSPSDMKSVRRFSQVWSRISAEQQLAKALTRGPETAGPLNSHKLMLRAMSLMHTLSPDYLRRFLAQADAVLWLEHMNQQSAIKDSKPAPGKPARRHGTMAKAKPKSPTK